MFVTLQCDPRAMHHGGNGRRHLTCLPCTGTMTTIASGEEARFVRHELIQGAGVTGLKNWQTTFAGRFPRGLGTFLKSCANAEDCEWKIAVWSCHVASVKNAWFFFFFFFYFFFSLSPSHRLLSSSSAPQSSLFIPSVSLSFLSSLF